MLEQQKSPQVLVHLSDSIKIPSDTSISQSELIRTLCDGDLARTNYAVKTLRRFISIRGFVEVV
jgi:hypothetical protein